ncbi:unnamed protein product [Urochloa humidicola]
MKNRWDTMKKKYVQWKTLNSRATGLGRNPLNGCIVADDDLWKEQTDAMPGCDTFKTTPLEHEDLQKIMFDVISVTNKTAYVPSRGGSAAAQGDELGEGDREDERATQNVGGKRSASPIPSPKGKKKNTFRDQCMKRLVDAYEMKAQRSKHSSATSQVIDHVRDEITKMMEQVIEDGTEEGGDEHYYATQLLNIKENRDMFQTLKTPNGRLNWLRRAWEDRNKS